jgi:nucleoid-associated protein YgaU
LTETFVRVKLKTEQTFGVLTMMIMNPSTSSYRSIYRGNIRETKELAQPHWLIRHMAKLMISLIVFTLVFSSFLIIGTNASSTVVEGPNESEQVVTVGSGDTLWSIASSFKNGSDIGYLVFSIKNRNNLDNVTIHPGQKLIIPDI